MRLNECCLFYVMCVPGSAARGGIDSTVRHTTKLTALSTIALTLCTGTAGFG